MYEAGKSDRTEGGEAFAGHSAQSRHSHLAPRARRRLAPVLGVLRTVSIYYDIVHRHCNARPPRFALSLAFAVR